MKPITRKFIASAAVGVAALGAGAAFADHDSWRGDNHDHGRYAPPERVYVVPAQPLPVYGERGWERREWRHRRNPCGVARWDPSLRYMPGDAVWRRGELFVARGISARVWNVNSPPEWTPNYWRPAACR